MRSESNADRVKRFMEELGRETTGPGRIYLTGGATAVLFGWRSTTVDVDLKADPEPKHLFEALAALKDRLAMNIELAAPDQFIPSVPGWQDRSQFIGGFGSIDFYHYDFYSQALAKIERGHGRDLADVRQMLARKLVEAKELRRLFNLIEPQLIRYPAIDPDGFRERLEGFLSGQRGQDA